MAGSQSAKPQVGHVSVFPPALHAPCKLDIPSEPATATFQGGMDDLPAAQRRDREGEEPERWDGMS